MEDLLAVLGMLLFMFLVMAAAVEAILEVFRGILEMVGIRWVKSKISLDDALKLAKEFSPENGDLNTKLEAIKSAAVQVSSISAVAVKSLDSIKAELNSGAAAKLNEIAGKLNEVAMSVKIELDKSERLRIFVLRFLATLIGCALAYFANFYIFRMLIEVPAAKEMLANLPGLQTEWVNILVGGLAASAGSSYWHDKLDKVRNLKTMVQDVKK